MTRHLRFLIALLSLAVVVSCSTVEQSHNVCGYGGGEPIGESQMPLHNFDGVDPIPTPAVVADQGEWPTVQVPDDNDDIDAASFNTATEALVNRTNWLARRLEESPPVPDSYAATVTLDMKASRNHEIAAMTGNMTIVMNGLVAGRHYTVFLLQNGAGGHTVTWPGGTAFGDIDDQPNLMGLVGTTFSFYRTSFTLVCVGRT